MTGMVVDDMVRVSNHGDLAVATGSERCNTRGVEMRFDVHCSLFLGSPDAGHKVLLTEYFLDRGRSRATTNSMIVWSGGVAPSSLTAKNRRAEGIIRAADRSYVRARHGLAVFAFDSKVYL